eukprot:66194_1
MSISEVLVPIHLLSIHNKNASFKSDQTLQTYTSHMSRTKSSSSSLEHVLILDYDDTLMPTTYLLSNIDYNMNKKTKKITSFTIGSKLNPTQRLQFISNLDKSGQSCFKLLTKIFTKFKAINIKIVTNGVQGWIPDSLYIAASFCPIYTNILHLLGQQQVAIIYARNQTVKRSEWKVKCFDQILWQYLNGQQSNAKKSVNVVTVGDQWLDHQSIKRSLTHHCYGHCINHHQIKLFPNPDCRYLCVELDYISTLLDLQLLFTFHSEGLLLEFDGYNDSDK